MVQPGLFERLETELKIRNDSRRPHKAWLGPVRGAIQTQQQVVVATESVDSLTRKLAGIARRSYEVGLEALRPSNTFGKADELPPLASD